MLTLELPTGVAGVVHHGPENNKEWGFVFFPRNFVNVLKGVGTYFFLLLNGVALNVF